MAQSRADAGTGTDGEQTGTGTGEQPGMGVVEDEDDIEDDNGEVDDNGEFDGFEEVRSASEPEPDDNTVEGDKLVVADVADMGTTQSSGQGVEQAVPPPATTATALPNPYGETEGSAAVGMAGNESATDDDEGATGDGDDAEGDGEARSQARFPGRSWSETVRLLKKYGETS